MFIGEQGWHIGESVRLPPMWPGFNSRTQRHMFVEFVVGSRPCSEAFSPYSLVFLPPQKTTLQWNSNSILALQVLSILFILLAWTRDEEKNLSPRWKSNPWSSAHRVGWMFQINYMFIIWRICCLSVVSLSGFVGEASPTRELRTR